MPLVGKGRYSRCRLPPCVTAVQAAVLGIDPGRRRLIGQCCPSVGQISGEDACSVPVDEQGAGPAAMPAMGTAGHGLSKGTQPRQAAGVAVCPAVGGIRLALPLRVGAVTAGQASGKDKLPIPGGLARLRSWTPEQDGHAGAPAARADISFRPANLHNPMISDLESGQGGNDACGNTPPTRSVAVANALSCRCEGGSTRPRLSATPPACPAAPGVRGGCARARGCRCPGGCGWRPGNGCGGSRSPHQGSAAR
jgi:hypothetical protein